MYQVKKKRSNSFVSKIVKFQRMQRLTKEIFVVSLSNYLSRTFHFNVPHHFENENKKKQCFE